MDIMQVSKTLSAYSCPHLDSWILLRAIEDGTSNLADRLQDAERRIVELEMGNGTPWKGEKRKGWLWDDAIDSWVEKPASTIKKRKSKQEKTGLPSHGRRDRQSVAPKRVAFDDNISQTASPLSKFLQRATGNPISKPSSRSSKPPTRKPATLPISPLPIAPSSDDPLGDISTDSPHQVSHTLRAQDCRVAAAWTRESSHKTPSKLVIADSARARHHLLYSSPTSPFPVNPESDDPLADLSGNNTPRWNSSARTVTAKSSQHSPARKGWGSKRSYDSHLESVSPGRTESYRSYLTVACRRPEYLSP